MSHKETIARKGEQLAASASPSALLALAGIGLMAGATPALAQEEPRLGGVTVTDTAIEESYTRAEIRSDKATAPLVDTPQTVSVIPQELIRDRGARTLAEVLRNTPGISFDAGENGFGTSTNNFTLRGFDTSGSVFIDNARDSGSYTRDVFTIESVEVVKGAASGNGRGSAGGYVNINTKKPVLDAFIAGDLSYGFDQYDSKDRKRGSIDINQPLGGGIALRLNAVVEDSGIAGRELAKNKLWGVAPSIGFGLDGRLRFIASWEHVERDDRPDWGVPGATRRDLITFNSDAAGAPRDAFYGLRSDFDDSTSDAVLGRFEFDAWDGAVLTNQTRWTRVDRTARMTAPVGFDSNATRCPDLVCTQTWFYDRRNTSLTNLTNLSSKFDTGGVSHSLTAGVELTWEKSNAGRFDGVNQAAGNDVLNPNPDRVAGPAFNLLQTGQAKVNTFALYLNDTLSFGDAFQINGGVRFEAYDVDIISQTVGGASQGPADGFNRSWETFSGHVGAVFKPSENSSIYVSFGTSTLPPGSYLSNPDISRTGNNNFPGFVEGAKPVRSHNYEAGVKFDLLDGGLSTTLAVFRTEKRNVAVADAAGAVAGYHKQRVQGVELGLAGAVTPDWNIYGGLLVMESKRKISDALEAVRDAANPGDYTAAFPASGLDGDRLAFTPNFSASLWTSYRLPIGLTVGAGVQHQGSSYLGRPDDATRIIPNGRFGKLPSYTLVNAMLAYDLTDAINLRLNIDNIANEKYALTTNWNGSRASLGAPRSYMLSAGFRF